jgi:hypothetical protein
MSRILLGGTEEINDKLLSYGRLLQGAMATEDICTAQAARWCYPPKTHPLHSMREGEDGMALELETNEEAQGLLAPPSSLPLIRPSE